MKTRLSVRWKLVLLGWSLAFGMAVLLVLALQVRTEEALLDQLQKTLGAKCDEVVTILQGKAPPLTLADFVEVETVYRSSPFTYFYQITDSSGQVLARSNNLRKAALPTPDGWTMEPSGNLVRYYTTAHPLSEKEDESIHVRHERILITDAAGNRDEMTIRIAACLSPLTDATRQQFVSALPYVFGGLTAVFLLLWFVTTLCLKRVSEIAHKASEIGATNPQERLPLSGRNDELDQLARVLNRMLDRLEASLENMEQFTSDAAHQLRTPLTRIRGELDLILEDVHAEPLRNRLLSLQEELERLSRLCGRLLLLARLDQKNQQGHLFNERVRVDDLLGELIEQMTPVAHAKGVRLEQRDLSPAEIRGSKLLVTEAALNLIHNAVCFTPEGNSVEVAMERKNDLIAVSVKDSGPGIPEEERERVFQRFYRRPGSHAGEGTGLGLAIAKAIARAHGGQVELDGSMVRGSCFRLIFPELKARQHGPGHRMGK